LNGGPFGSKLVQRDYVETGIPVIRGCNLPVERKFSSDEFVFVSPEKADELLPNNAHSGDLVFTQRGTLGQVGIIPDGLPYSRYVISQSQMKLTVDSNKADANYVYYVFRVPETVKQIHNRAFSSGVPHINLEILRDFEIDLPPLSNQGRIASILSAYDDLIQNNARRTKILEKVAQMIYREWFVNFRFPGHGKVGKVESEMGTVPKGWPVQKVTEAIEVDPTTKVPKVGMKPFVSMGALSHTSMLITNIEQREGNSGSKFRNGDTLFARITPCLENGKTGFVQFLPDCEAVGFGSTEFMVLRSRTVNPAYVYLMARSGEFRNNAIRSMSGATGRQRVQGQSFDRFLIACPPLELLQAFRDAVTPMFRLIYALSLKNRNLRTTRDLLLPKLISGEVSVERFESEAVAQSV